MTQNSNFRLPRDHRFGPKFDFTVKVPNHGGDPLGSILGPMGSHLVQKMGQNRKKLPCPKIRIFDYPPVIDFGQNWTLRLWRQITEGTPLGPSWGQWGPIGSKKWVKTIKNYHAPKFEFSTTPRSSISTKIRLYGYGAKSPWGPPSVHLGANGVPLGTKMGQNHKKLPCPKIRIFNYPAVIDFGQNLTLRLWRQITEGTPKCVHLGANGVPLGKIMGQNRKKLPCPKIRIFDYPALINFGLNSTWRLWGEIMVGNP